MRKSMLLLAVFGLAGSLWAADPSVGTWKLNVAKSKFAPSTQAAVKEETVVVREVEADQIEITFTGTRTDGTAISTKLTRPKQGGAVKGQPPLSEGSSYIDTVIEPGNWYVTILQSGKQVTEYHCVVSKDGKIMSWTIKGTDAKGKPYEALEVWEKQ